MIRAPDAGGGAVAAAAARARSANPFSASRTASSCGHFLIDREGIIRWRDIKAGERIGNLARFPADDGILRAARSL